MLRAQLLAFKGRVRYQRRRRAIDSEIGAKLPESYMKFYAEWKSDKKKPVHYIPEEGRYKLNEKGQVVPVVNVPIPTKYTKEQHLGIWGGEAVVQGYRRPAHRYETPVPEFWVPRLLDHIVYSEILDKYLNVTVTQRTIDLIHQHYGFDEYILATPACDLNSLLACKIKRKMLLALYEKSLYPDDTAKRETVYEKFKHHLEGYSRDDLEWYGLSVPEAEEKYVQIDNEARERAKVPLKVTFRKEFLDELRQMKVEGTLDKDKEEVSLLTKFNPFAKS